MRQNGTMNASKLLKWAGLCILFLCVRLLMALPFLLIHLPKGSAWDMPVKCVISLLIWIFLVLPERGYHCWAIMRMNGDTDVNYSYVQALKVGLVRVLHVLYILVPVLALIMLLYYILNSNIGTLRILKDIGSIFGSQRRYGYDIGLGILLGLLAFFLILLLVRWYRHTPSDYLNTAKPLRKAPYDVRALRNALLAAIAYLLWAAILIMFIWGQISGSSGLFAKATKLPGAIDHVLHQREFIVEMLLVLVLVYCPLWCVRKHSAARAAAALDSHAA